MPGTASVGVMFSQGRMLFMPTCPWVGWFLLYLIVVQRIPDDCLGVPDCYIRHVSIGASSCCGGWSADVLSFRFLLACSCGGYGFLHAFERNGVAEVSVSVVVAVVNVSVFRRSSKRFRKCGGGIRFRIAS